jgi:NADPH:quinone reductase
MSAVNISTHSKSATALLTVDSYSDFISEGTVSPDGKAVAEASSVPALRSQSEREPMMKAVVLTEFGGLENLSLDDVPIPRVGQGSVLLRAVAASANQVDVSICKGASFSPSLPGTIGCDVAGLVDAVGDGVTEFAPGDEVFGCVGGVRGSGGTLAQYVLADVKLLAPKPKTLSMREAAALPLVAITAHEGMTRGGVSPTHRTLIHGGTGGVGHVAVQLAAALGAKVFTTVSAGSQAMAMRMGATDAVDYRAETVEAYVKRLTDGEGFDVIFDTIGNQHLVESFQAARNGGQVVSTMAMTQLDLKLMHLKGLSLHIIFMLLPLLTGIGRERHGAILREVTALVDAGKLQPLVDETRFTLTTAADAYRYLVSGEAKGKVVIDIMETAQTATNRPT